MCSSDLLTGILLESHEKLLLSIFLTTSSWIIVTLLTKPTDKETLLKFYEKIQPYGIGWNSFLERNNLARSNNKDSALRDLKLMFLSIVLVYFGLFGMGFLLFGKLLHGLILLCLSFISGYFANNIMSSIQKN